MDMIQSPIMDDHTARDITGRSKGRSRRRHTGKVNSSPVEPRQVKRELSQRDRAKFYSKVTRKQIILYQQQDCCNDYYIPIFDSLV